MSDTKLKVFLLILPVLSILLVISCEEKKNPVAEYGKTLINAYDRSKKTGKQATLTGIQKAIQLHHVTHGEYPRTLKDIEKTTGFPLDPELYDYNPESGEIQLKK